MDDAGRVIAKIPLDKAKTLARLFVSNTDDVNEVRRGIEELIKVMRVTGDDLIKSVSSVSKGDAKILKITQDLLGRKQAPTASDALAALSDALSSLVPGGKINVLGRIGSEIVVGSARTGIGIVELGGRTIVVQVKNGQLVQILGALR